MLHAHIWSGRTEDVTGDMTVDRCQTIIKQHAIAVESVTRSIRMQF